MAERVKRRVAAARLAVAFVAAGSIAGATAWASASPPPTAQSSASDIFAKIGDIKGEQIEDHSLSFKDFIKGEIPSFKMFEKLDQSFFKYKKATNSFKYDVNGDLNAIKGELPAYIKMNDADSRYYKHSEPLVQGDGSVFTATGVVPGGNNPSSLLSVPNLISVETLPGGAIQVTNTSGGDLDYSACAVGAGGGTLKPGEKTSCATGDHTNAMQLLGGAGGSQVVTLNFTKIGPQVTVQILIGL